MKKTLKALFIASLVIMSACGTAQNETTEKVEAEKKEETVNILDKVQEFDVEQLSERLEVKNETVETSTLFKVTEGETVRSFFVHPFTLDLNEAREVELTVCVWNNDSTIQTFDKKVKIGTDEEIAQVIKEKEEKIAKAEEEKKAKDEANKKAKGEEKNNQEQTKKEENKATPTPTADTTQVASFTPVPSTPAPNTPTPTEAPKYTYQCWNGQWAYDASGCPAHQLLYQVQLNQLKRSVGLFTTMPNTQLQLFQPFIKQFTMMQFTRIKQLWIKKLIAQILYITIRMILYAINVGRFLVL